MYVLCVCACDLLGSSVEVEDNLRERVFFFYCVGPKLSLMTLPAEVFCLLFPSDLGGSGLTLVCSRTGIGKRCLTLVFLVQTELLPDATVSMEDNPEASASLFLLCVTVL